MGKSTVSVARELRVPFWKLHRLLTEDRIPKPPLIGGSYIWFPENVEAARHAIGERTGHVQTSPANNGRAA